MIRPDIKNCFKKEKHPIFYEELSEKKRKEYFNQKTKSYLPNIDNVYYTVSFQGDCKDNNSLRLLNNLLEKKKQKVRETRESVKFFGDLYIDYKSFNVYKYCLTVPDLYDIFILDYLPNEETPRVMVQLRADGLWLNGYKKMLEDSYNDVVTVFNEFASMKVDKVVENRIDYCYHTNAIQKIDQTFGDRCIQNSMKTTMYTWHATGRIQRDNGLVRLKKDYFALGERKSNYVFVRFYNKTIEVIEKGYKAYFYQIWLDNGLINFYDKYCFEYAYKNKNYEHIHKAKLEFYIEYGKDESRKAYYKSVLDDVTKTITDIEKIASEYMPECTSVMNVEFETKRKFYYLSDNFIDNLLCVQFPAQVEEQRLLRIMTILDNRHIFLDYLTHNNVRFVKKSDNTKYVDWWERLRNVKHKDCTKSNLKLVREYSNDLDLEVMKKRAVNAVGALSVYMQKSADNTFVEDITDIFSLINDNDKHDKETYHKFVVVDDNGEIINSLQGEALKGYNDKKARKEKLLRNRFKVKTYEEKRKDKLEFARQQYELRQADKKGDNDV